MSRWSDIPGVTSGHDGQARLPCRPDVVARAFARAVGGAGEGMASQAALTAAIVVETNEDPVRVQGILGWLPVSRVAAWDPETGALWLDPATDAVDLAVRYAAWASSQPIPSTHVEPIKQYVRAVVEETARLGPSGRRATGDAPAIARPAEGRTEIAPPLLSPDLTARVRALLAGLDEAFLERGRHARLALLALLAGQHVLLLGPPGTGKSLLARALCRCFADEAGEARYFEYLLSRFSHPDELFGPVSIPGLKEEDYRRLVDGFLPTAHVAFLDEIFKANSAILNSLLALVNERVFHHGRHRDPVPLVGLIGASNELPDPDGGLAALYDRFLVRLAVPPIADPIAFLTMAAGDLPAFAPAPEHRLTLAELGVIRAAADEVIVDEGVAASIASLWRIAHDGEWGVSDRTWRHAVHFLRVAVATDGRRAVEPLDLLLLDAVLAPDPDRQAEVRDAILDHVGARGVPVHDLRAQWTLLHTDRVAPAEGEPPPPKIGPRGAWPERLARRAASVRRLAKHHAEAVERLALDRQSLEEAGASHLWIDRLPAQLLAGHIEASRDLVRILDALDQYGRAVGDAQGAVAAHLAMLPPASKRMYGNDATCTLHIVDAGQFIGLTLTGDALPVAPPAEATRAGTSSTHGPLVAVEAARFLDWLDGAATTEALLATVPAWGARQAATALDSARKNLGDAVPRPPELPSP